jgi:hypothetical protein
MDVASGARWNAGSGARPRELQQRGHERNVALNPAAYTNAPSGDIFVQFDVPQSAIGASDGVWGKIFGPNSIFGPVKGITQMPPATYSVVPANDFNRQRARRLDKGEHIEADELRSTSHGKISGAGFNASVEGEYCAGL